MTPIMTEQQWRKLAALLEVASDALLMTEPASLTSATLDAAAIVCRGQAAILRNTYKDPDQ